MIFLFSEDGIVQVLADEKAVKAACEPVDVENKVFVFYAENGAWLKPVFTKPNRRFFGLWLVQGEYDLVPSSAVEVDTFEIAISEAVAVEPNQYFKSLEEIRNHVARASSGQ